MTGLRVALPELGDRVGKKFGVAPLRYRALYALALDGRFPVVRTNGRLYVDETHFGLVAQAYGIEIKELAA
jgi:hypothetical protein